MCVRSGTPCASPRVLRSRLRIHRVLTVHVQSTPLMLALEHSHTHAALVLLWHGATFDAAAAGDSQLLHLWRTGALRTWSALHHRLYPPAFRRDLAALLLATRGSLDTAGSCTGTGTGTGPGAENPLRRLLDAGLLGPLSHALLRVHLGGPPCGSATADRPDDAS